MLLLIIKEKVYKENSNIKLFLKEASSALISSMKIKEMPVKGIPGKWIFSQDFTCRLYFVKAKPKTKDDLNKLDVIKQLAENYPDMIYQQWFKSYSPGRYELRVTLIENQYVNLNSIIPVKKTKAKDTLRFNDTVIIN
jgi:hypothetical protein